jgi:general stress protein 26
MTESTLEIQDEVWRHLKASQCVYLATAEADQPRVRPVTLLDIDRKFWIATGTRSAKARQMLRNPNVEFCLPLSEECGAGYVRVAGVANVISDRQIRERIGSKIPFLTDYWSGPDDPSFCLIRITRVEIEYLRPGDQDAVTFIV